MEVKELEFGAPLGWTPKSLLTWNGSFLPYSFRFDDMRFDLGLGSLPERTVIEWDLLTGVTREWASYDVAEEALGITGISQSMRKNALIKGHIFFHRKTNPPSQERIKKLTELAKVSRSFGYVPRGNKRKGSDA